MRLGQAALMAVIAAATSTSAFQTHIGARHSRSSSAATTSLNAFQLKDGEVANMFEGPRPLVKERDACGVGFIANTKSGGEYCCEIFPTLNLMNICYELSNLTQYIFLTKTKCPFFASLSNSIHAILNQTSMCTAKISIPKTK